MASIARSLELAAAMELPKSSVTGLTPNRRQRPPVIQA
jgi:hypothetical protein